MWATANRISALISAATPAPRGFQTAVLPLNKPTRGAPSPHSPSIRSQDQSLSPSPARSAQEQQLLDLAQQLMRRSSLSDATMSLLKASSMFYMLLAPRAMRGGPKCALMSAVIRDLTLSACRCQLRSTRAPRGMSILHREASTYCARHHASKVLSGGTVVALNAHSGSNAVVRLHDDRRVYVSARSVPNYILKIHGNC